jgi:hypothetical protein
MTKQFTRSSTGTSYLVAYLSHYGYKLVLTNNLKNVPVCFVISYIVDVFGSFIDYKPNNMNNNKDAKG